MDPPSVDKLKISDDSPPEAAAAAAPPALEESKKSQATEQHIDPWSVEAGRDEQGNSLEFVWM
jgi:hypothetical protein